MKKVRLIVRGLVQGVGYRYFCYKKAAKCGITGYAKNLNDGNVLVEAEGEQSVLYNFIEELKIGPSNANVSAVTIEEFPYENEFKEFKIY